MNDDTLHPWIEPEFEARIIALILGEASDFEKEEVLRRIEESPEAALFYKRMLNLHALLGTIPLRSEQENEEWKLSEERREKLVASIGEPRDKTHSSPAPISSPQSNLSRRRRRRIILQVAASIGLLALITSAVIPTYNSMRSSGAEMSATDDYAYNESAMDSKESWKVETSEEMPSKPGLSLSDALADSGIDQAEGLDTERNLRKKNDASYRNAGANPSLPEPTSTMEKPEKPSPSRFFSLSDAEAKGATNGIEGMSIDGDTKSKDQVLRRELSEKSSRPAVTTAPAAGPVLDTAQPAEALSSPPAPIAAVDPARARQDAVPMKSSDLSGGFTRFGAEIAETGLKSGKKLSEERFERESVIEVEKESASRDQDMLASNSREATDLPAPAANTPAATGKPVPVTPVAPTTFESPGTDPFDDFTFAGGEAKGGLPQGGTANRQNNSSADEKNQSLWMNTPADSRSPGDRTAVSGSGQAPAQAGRIPNSSTDSPAPVSGNEKSQVIAATDGNLSRYDSSVLKEREASESKITEHLAREKQNLDSVLPEDRIIEEAGKLRVEEDEISLKKRVEEENRRALDTDTRAIPIDEKNAKEEPFSTFSLHVGDSSFHLARAALANSQWPERESIRVEEFVNALDYRDPIPTHEEKVGVALDQARHPFVQQRNLLRISLATAARGRQQSVPLRLTLLLDNSGSMERPDRRETVQRALALLIDQLQENDEVTLISFARQPRLLADRVTGEEAEALVNRVATLPSEGGTNLEAALDLAFQKAQEQQAPNAQNRIILLTDGAANLGDAEPVRLGAKIETFRDAGIAFDAAGIGAKGLNDEILEALTRKGDGRYYLLDRPEDADAGFARQIAGALRPAAGNVKVQVEFNPDRVGAYQLIGFEKHRLEKEDFRNDAVDAAELAAAEAGVAVYQVEAKPEGRGDIGSISVRFRDLSTGDMVEKRWPIVYDANTPLFEQAAPAIRIAGSAAFLGSRLREDALGQTVDLGTLSQVLNDLPSLWKRDQGLQQLREMLRQTRSLTSE